jgi:hypothetical protein
MHQIITRSAARHNSGVRHNFRADCILSKPLLFLHLITRHLNFHAILSKPVIFLHLITRHLNFHTILSKPLFFLRLITRHLNFHAILSKPLFFLLLITRHLNFHTILSKPLFFLRLMMQPKFPRYFVEAIIFSALDKAQPKFQGQADTYTLPLIDFFM